MGERKYSRSVSQLKKYSRCGEQYRLERMVRPRLPSRPASWLAGGIAFQSAADEWEIEGRNFDLAERVEMHYWDQIDRLKQEQPDLELWIKPPRSTVENDIKNRLKSAKTTWVENYLRYAELDWEIWKTPFNEPALEVEFTYTFPNGVTVNGGIDRMVWWPKEDLLVIEDIKTGNREKDFRQLGLYGFVANKLFADDILRPIDNLRYWYAKDGGASEWENTWRWTEDYLAAEYGALDTGIQNKVFVANPGDHCGLCGVKEYCRLMGYLKEGEELR